MTALTAESEKSLDRDWAGNPSIAEIWRLPTYDLVRKQITKQKKHRIPLRAVLDEENTGKTANCPFPLFQIN